MDPTLLTDATRAAHLLGLALGFGLAILADVLAARAVLRPLDWREVELLGRLHRMVTLGLVVLWASGLTLLWLRTGFDLGRFSPKLVTKIGIVTVLTLNAWAIGRVGLPTLVRYQGWRFGDLPLPERVQLCALGALSAASWVSALALGVFSQLRSMEWSGLTPLVAAVYLFALSLAVIGATITPVIAFAVRLFERRAAMR